MTSSSDKACWPRSRKPHLHHQRRRGAVSTPRVVSAIRGVRSLQVELSAATQRQRKTELGALRATGRESAQRRAHAQNERAQRTLSPARLARVHVPSGSEVSRSCCAVRATRARSPRP